MTTATMAGMEGELREVVTRAARHRPAKELARKIGCSPRTIYNLRSGVCEPNGLTLLALAQQVPELRAAVARWLGLAPGPQSSALRARLEALLAEQPEEGDQNQ